MKTNQPDQLKQLSQTVIDRLSVAIDSREVVQSSWDVCVEAGRLAHDMSMKAAESFAKDPATPEPNWSAAWQRYNDARLAYRDAWQTYQDALRASARAKREYEAARSEGSDD